MIHRPDFISRLEKILEYYELSASAFADAIGVQRSSLSHLLSGRNKPSLDFVLKVIAVYNEVDLYWLLLGKGNFPKEDTITSTEEKNISRENNLFAPSLTKEITSPPTLENNNINSSVEKVVLFFSDGTFKEYTTK